MDDPNIEKRTASGLAVNLSSYLITGSLAVLGAEAVVVTFVMDKRESLGAFAVLSVLACTSLVTSILCGGRGISELMSNGAKGEWAISSRSGWFDWQALLTLIGIVLLGVSLFLGRPKENEFERELHISSASLRQASDQLRKQVDDIQEEQRKLAIQVEKLIPSTAYPSGRSKSKKAASGLP